MVQMGCFLPCIRLRHYENGEYRAIRQMSHRQDNIPVQQGYRGLGNGESPIPPGRFHNPVELPDSTHQQCHNGNATTVR